MTLFRNRIALAGLGICSFVLLLAVVVSLNSVALVATAEAANPKISVAVGQSVTQRVPTNIKTVSIANSDIADVVVAGPRELLVNGKAVGFTTLVVWDDNNVSSLFSVVVRGAFSDQQIELRVQVAEVNRSKSTEFGVDMLFNQDNSPNNKWQGGSYGGKVATPTIPLQIFSNDENGSGNPVENASMALRYISGGTDVTAMIHALQENGVLKILAEPNVVAASGHTANFLAGGEFPVPIASSGSTGGSTVTIEYKEFGVKVNFLPTIVDSGVINLKVAPEVSALDFNNGIVLSGFQVPALTVRRAETTVELEDGQVLVIGGLLTESERNVTRRIPILGHLPLVGLLFSDTQKERTQQELLLVVSPHIIRALPKGTEVALPGQGED